MNREKNTHTKTCAHKQQAHKQNTRVGTGERGGGLDASKQAKERKQAYTTSLSCLHGGRPGHVHEERVREEGQPPPRLHRVRLGVVAVDAQQPVQLFEDGQGGLVLRVKTKHTQHTPKRHQKKGAI